MQHIKGFLNLKVRYLASLHPIDYKHYSNETIPVGLLGTHLLSMKL
jgi:hypothetical protein